MTDSKNRNQDSNNEMSSRITKHGKHIFNYVQNTRIILKKSALLQKFQ